MTGYKVVVNRDDCISCGVAPSICSQVFELGEDNGKTKIVSKFDKKTTLNTSEGEVPDELYNCVKEASDSCPVQAILIKRK